MDNITSDEKCAYCQEEFINTKNESIHQTDCNHRFHRKCVEKYLSMKENIGKKKFPCPLCLSRCSTPTRMDEIYKSSDLKVILCTRHFIQLVHDIHDHRTQAVEKKIAYKK